jgi:hypothetical protein
MTESTPKTPEATDWRILYRPIGLSIYQGWKEFELELAAKKGIAIPDIDTLEKKNSSESCAAFTALYECMLQHFRQMTDEEWRNF